MFFEITGFSQKPTALIQKDEGFRYKCVVGVLALQMLKQILRALLLRYPLQKKDTSAKASV